MKYRNIGASVCSEKHQMTALVGPDWLDQHVLPDIQNMLMQDAYFKLAKGFALDIP